MVSVCFLFEMNQFFKEQVPLVEQDLGKKINHHEVTFMLQVLPLFAVKLS